MAEITWRDIDFTLHVLLKIQNPTPRVIAAQNKLADILCGLVETLEERATVPRHVLDAVNAVKGHLDNIGELKQPR